MNLLKTAAKIGIVYFVLFSIFYIYRFMYAYREFMRFHSTTTGVDFARTIIAGKIVFEKDVVAGYTSPILFTLLGTLAVIGFLIWVYYTIWRNKPDPLG